MALREDGEFELVFGNRQLFGVLAIVVILLGIFFAMGWFARGSVDQARTKATEAHKSPPDQNPIVMDTVTNPQTATGPQSPVAMEEQPPTEQSAPAVRETPKPEPVKKESAKKESTKKEAPKKEVAEKPAVPVEPAPKASAAHGLDEIGQPPPGLYAQVSAEDARAAQLTAGLLHKQGIPVRLMNSSRPGLVRVLAGPFKNAAERTDMVQKLKGVGYPNPILQSY